eukprot:219102_1
MLEFSIEISKYTKNLSDIRSFCNNNNNNNNKNITNSSNTFSNTFSNTSSNTFSYKTPLPSGCFGCDKGCRICTIKNRNGTTLLLQGDHYISSKLDHKIHINQHFNCNSNWVIYIILCIYHGIESVGSTKQKAKKRIGQHLNNILNNNNAREYPMVKHFNRIESECYCKENRLKNCRMIIIDGIDDPTLSDIAADQRINKLEIKYQGQLITHHNSGNDKLDFNNSGLNRRNYTDKFTNKNSKIKLNRPKGKRNGQLWNKNWIASSHITRDFKFNYLYIINKTINMNTALIYQQRYNKSQDTRRKNKELKAKKIKLENINKMNNNNDI